MGMYAQYEVGQYIYTDNARYKVTEIVDIAQPVANSEAWSGSNLLSPYEGDGTDEDPAGSTFTQEQATDQDILHAAFDVEFASRYILTFRFKGGNLDSSSASSLDASAQNHIDAWVSLTGTSTKEGTANTDYLQVGATFTIAPFEWTEVSWSFQDTLSAHVDGAKLNLVFSKMTTESTIATSMQLVKVQEVYDIRIMQKSINFVKKLMADPNFDTEEAADAKTELEFAIESIEEGYDTEVYDDVEAGTAMLEALDGFIEDFLGATTESMNSTLDGLKSPFSSLATWNNGTTYDNRFANLKMSGGRWAHRSSTDLPDLVDYLNCAIQRSQPFGDHTIKVVNPNFTPGKYFITAEVRVASCPSNAWTFNFDKSIDNATMFIGSNTYEIGEIPAGKDPIRVYAVGEIQEGEEFSAGFFIPGVEKANNTTGIAFFIKNIEVRAFNDVVDKINRANDWNTFLAQYNAAAGAIKNINEKLADSNYPYAKDSLQNALAIWKPYYDKVLEDGWIDAEGNDTGVAKNAELLDWALYQGVELYNEPEGEEEPTRLEYQLVRNLQWANNYSAARNQIITDFNALIATAEAELNDDMNNAGDKETFEGEISAAQLVIGGILAEATDDTYETDSITLADATKTLNQAIAAFKKSAELKPIIDIDFSNDFTAFYSEEEPNEVAGYVIKGAAGEMTFTMDDLQFDNNEAPSFYQAYSWDSRGWYNNICYKYQKGFANGDADNSGQVERTDPVFTDALRVGNSEVEVYLGEGDIPTDEDVIRVQFDLWIGNLSGRYVWVDLRNKDNVTVAGFKYNKYNGTVAYNYFNNKTGASYDTTEIGQDGGTGMDFKYARGLGSSSVSNAGIHADGGLNNFDLVIDYKAMTAQGTLVGNGTSAGSPMPLNKEVEDNKIVKFVLGSNYANNGERRSWFDNLKIFKYASSAEGPDPVSINAVADNAESNVAAGIYTITGVKVNALQKGFNIVKTTDGQVKKVFIE